MLHRKEKFINCEIYHIASKTKMIFLLSCFILLLPFFALASDRVEINTASLSQLEELVGVGPVIAQRITNDRPFSSVDDLLRVKGIGEKTLQKIKDQGLAYVSGQTQEPTQEIAQNENTINPTPDTQNPSSVSHPDNVFINELLPSPEGADESNEWIELYNSNNFEVDLFGWKLQDTQGLTASYTFAAGSKIPASGYLILKRPNTKITMNNEKDGLVLIKPDGKTISFVSYENAPKNQSYNNVESSWQWSVTTSPGSANIIKEQGSLAKPKKPGNIIESSKAAVSQPIGETSDALDQKRASNPWFWFLALGSIMIILGVIVLVLNRLSNKKF